MRDGTRLLALDQAKWDDWAGTIDGDNWQYRYLRKAQAAVISLQEFHRLLCPGGSVHILDPTADYLVLKFADRLIRILEPEHVEMYSAAEFAALMEAAGFVPQPAQTPIPHHKVHIGLKNRIG